MPVQRRNNVTRNEPIPRSTNEYNIDVIDDDDDEKSLHLRKRSSFEDRRSTKSMVLKLLFGVLFLVTITSTVHQVLSQSHSHESISKSAQPISYRERPSRDSFGSIEPQIRFNGLRRLSASAKGVSPYLVPESTSASLHQPDHGGLNITFMTDGSRKIRSNSERLSGEVYSYKRKGTPGGFDPYYAFDDDNVRASIFKKGNQCRRTSWHKLYYPTCNSAHETRIMAGDNAFLG